MTYWLMKSEPSVYGIKDLQRDHATLWDGVRNYQARNFLTSMTAGDQAFFYHSNTQPPGIVGLMTILETHQVDPSQFDPTNSYYDPKSTPNRPRWYTVRVGYLETFPIMLSLHQLQQTFSPEELWVVRRGNRLSVMPVAEAIGDRLLAMARK
ncbi:MAG: EVE domain-containing protein [Nodosilinea sp. LVE1205-7]|jgi:predicted RNA-binding protein with PUA-like domain